MSILVLGKDGQLGDAFASHLRDDEAVFWGREALDFTHPAVFEAKLKELSPSIIINAAAYTAVDLAESEKVLADQINHLAVAELARCAGLINARLIHYSTDYVFDGTQDTPYLETDAPAPLGVYGASKLAGERAVQASQCKHWIFRTSWVVSPHGKNFIKTILRLAQERTSLQVVDDQIGAPTSAAFIAQTTLAAVEADIPNGLYHLTCSGETSWYRLACNVVGHAAASRMDLTLHPEAIRPIQSKDYPTAAQRPKSSRLDCSKLFQSLECKQSSWHEVTEQIVRQLSAIENTT